MLDYSKNNKRIWELHKKYFKIPDISIDEMFEKTLEQLKLREELRIRTALKKNFDREEPTDEKVTYEEFTDEEKSAIKRYVSYASNSNSEKKFSPIDESAISFSGVYTEDEIKFIYETHDVMNQKQKKK